MEKTLIETRQLDLEFAKSDEMTAFLAECWDKQFLNNHNLWVMKYHWCIDDGGAWFGTFKDGKLISISGIHPFRYGYRALFRGVQLEPRQAGLSKHHMQSYCWHSQLPLQMAFAESYPIYITTNTTNDASGSMGKMDKLFELLSKLKLVDYVATEEVFFIEQRIWLLNKSRYDTVRSKY